jgi:hypothetical protein
MTLLRIRKNTLALSLTALATAVLMLNCGVQDFGPSVENGPAEEVIDLDVSPGKADNIWGVKHWSIHRYDGRIDIVGTVQEECAASDPTDQDCPRPLFEGQLRSLGPEKGLALCYTTRASGELKDGKILFDKDLNIISDIDKDSGLEILTVLHHELERIYENRGFRSCTIAVVAGTILGIIAVYTWGVSLGITAGELVVLGGDIAACLAAMQYTSSNSGDNDSDPAKSLGAPPVD